MRDHVDQDLRPKHKVTPHIWCRGNVMRESHRQPKGVYDMLVATMSSIHCTRNGPRSGGEGGESKNIRTGGKKRCPGRAQRGHF